jgi:hypothetical protein
VYHPLSRTDFQSYMRPLAVALQLSAKGLLVVVPIAKTDKK